jgi:hypothetical protein
MKKVGLLLLLFIFLQFAKAQNLQLWNAVGVDVDLSNKLTLETKAMVSVAPAAAFDVNFAQTGIALNYKLNKEVTLEVGDQLNIIPSSSRNLRNRIYVRGSYQWKFSEVFKSTHSIQAEWHGDNELRYDSRVILINGISTRNRYTPLNIRPSISYWLYYNIGGDPIQYYDEAGNAAVRQAASGFHRGRFYFSLNSKINDHVGISAYFMSQKEFNFLTDTYREINVVNPNTGNIARDFNNYNVLGISLNFNILNK